MGERQKPGFSLLLIGILCLCIFSAFVTLAKAQHTVLNDNFVSDNRLDTNLWTKNGPSGNDFFSRVSANVVSKGGPQITPTATAAAVSQPSPTNQTSNALVSPQTTSNSSSQPKSSSPPVSKLASGSASISAIVAIITLALPLTVGTTFFIVKSRKMKTLDTNAREGFNNTNLFLFFFVFALFVADVAIFLESSMFTVNLPEIASTFHVPVGTVGQVGGISRSAGIFVGVAMGLLSLKFNRKLLLVLGQLLVVSGALGSYFAPDFLSFISFQTVFGIGAPFVGISAITLVSEMVPLGKRGTAAGFLSSSLFVAGFLGSYVNGWISTSFNWRNVLLWWILPVVIASLILCIFIVPSKTKPDRLVSAKQYFGAFKMVLVNRSAVACMICTMCAFTTLQISTYVITFYRVHFAISLATGSIISSAGAAFAVVGAIVGGRLVNPNRRRPMIIGALFVSALVSVTFSFMPDLSTTLVLRYASALIGSLSSAAISTLVMEQVPKFRGTMMSLNSAIGVSFGSVLGLTIGGFVLNSFANNYQLAFVVLGSFDFVGAALVLFLTKDPTKIQKNDNKKPVLEKNVTESSKRAGN